MKQVIIDTLRKLYPHGAPDFISTFINSIELHSNKNRDYAMDGPHFGNFDRVASILSNYPNLSLSDSKVVAIIYMLKQMDATLWAMSNGHVMDEGLEERVDDMIVYCGIIQCMLKESAHA